MNSALAILIRASNGGVPRRASATLALLCAEHYVTDQGSPPFSCRNGSTLQLVRMRLWNGTTWQNTR